ncbi:hypothetical protein D3C72_2028960 [compost metagenome]
MPTLAPQQQPERHHKNPRRRQRLVQRRTLRALAQRKDQRRKGNHVKHRGHAVEAVRAARRLRQRAARDGQRQQADRQVDREQPWPGAERQDDGRHRRPDRK